jgi:serine/threonine protein kinase HipA of HipAB toxin-antitoxin module
MGPAADFRTSVDNEWLCLKIAEAYGLDVADADIATFGDNACSWCSASTGASRRMESG